MSERVVRHLPDLSIADQCRVEQAARVFEIAERDRQAIFCFRSAYSEWILDTRRMRYIRRPRTDVDQPDVRDAEAMGRDLVVPYYDDADWHRMDAYEVAGTPTTRVRLRVRDPEKPDWMTTTADRIEP